MSESIPAVGSATRLDRLLKPSSIAVAGGAVAAEVIRNCRSIGFSGAIWPIHPERAAIEGIPCFPTVEALPGAPDATFIAVSRTTTIDIVAALARRGAAGAVCYASGFAEVGAEGALLQERLVRAAGPMALLGPNCYGLINYLDGCALWPDPLAGERVERGVAILTQSGNIGLNLTLHRRHLPIAYMVAVGNKAVTDIDECIAAVLRDPRVTAIGLYLEGLSDVAAFAAVAHQALLANVPVVVLKAGASDIGRELAASHTRSLAGSDVLYTALFKRLGIARAHDLGEFLETLKLFHTLGIPGGRRVGSLSCSGGDALLMADLGQRYGLEFPRLDEDTAGALSAVLGPLVAIHNPLDYQAYIWGDEKALTACFQAMLRAELDVCVLVLDVPHDGGASEPGWDEVVTAFIAACATSRIPALMVASMPELMPEHVAQRLRRAGIAPMQGLRETVAALAAGAAIAERRQRPAWQPLSAAPRAALVATHLLDEQTAKHALARFGLAIPASQTATDVASALKAAAAIGYPVVVKALAEGLAHKTERGAVRLDLKTPEEVQGACSALLLEFPAVLVEAMVTAGAGGTGATIELIVGVTCDPQFGLALTIGAGGILVELLADSATLLLPASRADLEEALSGLRIFKLLEGYRGRAPVNLEAVFDAIEAIARFAEAHAEALVELDVNPLIASEKGAVAVDALIRLTGAPAPS